jgi:hypothetical protein
MRVHSVHWLWFEVRKNGTGQGSSTIARCMKKLQGTTIEGEACRAGYDEFLAHGLCCHEIRDEVNVFAQYCISSLRFLKSSKRIRCLFLSSRSTVLLNPLATPSSCLNIVVH